MHIQYLKSKITVTNVGTDILLAHVTVTVTRTGQQAANISTRVPTNFRHVLFLNLIYYSDRRDDGFAKSYVLESLV